MQCLDGDIDLFINAYLKWIALAEEDHAETAVNSMLLLTKYR